MKALLILILTVLGTLAGCSDEQLSDVSDNKKFQPLIGKQYEVIGMLYAYGIRQYSKAPVEQVTLIPPPGIGGLQVGFRIQVPLGSKITILRVLKTNRVFDPDIDYLVKLEGTNLPVDVPVRIALYRGNQGAEFLQLNPTIYRKLAAL